ncbi:MAG: hypothetical protein GVY36_04210 [Verrucomicrobia bacterium]|jgi:hypothetical protein|nr:hypothetical protein [Verrucomicrobiota bacterium]
MKTNKGDKYYTRPYALWALLTSAIVIASLGGAVYDAIQGSSPREILISRGLVGVTCSLLSFWLSALVSWLLPICLSKEGLRSYTAFGIYRSVGWAEFERVEALSLFGIRYAKIYLKAGGFPIWIPEFLTKRDRFLAQLRQRTAHAGAVEEAFTGAVDHSGFVSTRVIEAGS